MSTIERAFAAKLSEQEARALTDEVKRDATALCNKLVLLKEGGADAVLGYPSWTAYCEKEFGLKRQTASWMLQAGRVLRELENADVKPINVMQAGELAPLLKDPNQLRETWDEIAKEALDQPVRAIAVREKVRSVREEMGDIVAQPVESTFLKSIFEAAYVTEVAFGSIRDLERGYLSESELERIIDKAEIAYDHWGSIVEKLRSI